MTDATLVRERSSTTSATTAVTAAWSSARDKLLPSKGQAAITAVSSLYGNPDFVDEHGWAWIGPEVAAFGDRDYQQWRLGFHVTAFRTGRFEWSAGVGEAWDTDHRSGVYAHIGLLTRR